MPAPRYDADLLGMAWIWPPLRAIHGNHFLRRAEDDLGASAFVQGVARNQPACIRAPGMDAIAGWEGWCRPVGMVAG